MAENNPQLPQGQSIPTGASGQVQVKIEDAILRGAYANMMQVGHTAEEFVLDFMNIVGGAGIVASRVIVSPGHMKRIAAALQDNLAKYEAQFGKIQAGDAPAAAVGFRTE